jgi:hypothetical protein
MELFVKYDHDTEQVTSGPQSGMAGEPGWLPYIGDNPSVGSSDMDGDRFIEELGAVVRVSIGALPEPSYQQQRAMSYPDIGEQLDLLFHDISTGNLSTDGGLYQALLAVKTQFPKD